MDGPHGLPSPAETKSRSQAHSMVVLVKGSATSQDHPGPSTPTTSLSKEQGSGGGFDKVGIAPLFSLPSSLCSVTSEDEAWVHSLNPRGSVFLVWPPQISRLEREAALGLGNPCLIGSFHAVLLALDLRVKGVTRGQLMLAGRGWGGLGYLDMERGVIFLFCWKAQV